MSAHKPCPLSDTWYHQFCVHQHDMMTQLQDCPARMACQHFKQVIDMHEKQMDMLMGFIRPSIHIRTSASRAPMSPPTQVKPAPKKAAAKKVVRKRTVK